MRIGIIGSGDVGQALGRGFTSRGHEVMLGTRDPSSEKVRSWAERAGPKAQTGTFAETASFAELAVIATRWDGTQSAIKLAGPHNFEGKVVIDVTNPLAFSPGRPPTLAVGHTDSGGEQVQRWLPGARVVKAFNIITNGAMVDPQFVGGPPDMFLCGNDESAKRTVTGICQSFGWPVTDIGDISGARLLEPLAMLWVTIGARTGQWNHAWKLIRS